MTKSGYNIFHLGKKLDRIRIRFTDTFANPNSPVLNINSIVRITEFVPISEVFIFMEEYMSKSHESELFCSLQGSIS